MPARVPVVLLSGGLGSGKTTLLNHLLEQGVGRIGVVVNDFGDIAVDAFLVQGQVDATATISGGCLCCLSDPSELDDTLASLAAPALDLDVIVVEASGLAEPRELARMILSSGVRAIRFGGVVEVLDAAAWAQADPQGPLPVATDHLQVASVLVVNKIDRLEGHPEATRRLDQAIARHAPHTPVVRTTFGRVDPSLLFDAAERETPTGQLSFADLLRETAGEHGDAHGHGHAHGHAHDAHHGHAHESCTSVSVDSPLGTSPRQLVDVLENRSPGVYRVKGRTWFDAPGHRVQYVVQAVGGWLAFERSPWPAGTRRGTQIVAVGTDMDDAAVEADLRSCLTDEPVPADHLHAVIRLTR